MVTAETLGFSPEQQQAYQQIAGFFGRAEREFPAAAGQLVNVVGGLAGDQQTTRRELQEGMGNIDIGLALIGDWLKETGAEGFEVKLGLGGGTKKAIGRRQVKFPTASDLIRVGGRVNVDLQKQIPPLLSSFSRQIRGGLDVGLSPRQIVGGLVAESVGSRLSNNGSATLRLALEKPLGGHFEWIREALKIPDAAGQPGFQPMAAARWAREEARRRVEEKRSWQEVAGEMGRNAFAIIGFENSGGNEIVAAAAFEFRSEIAGGTMNKEAFTAMMKEINGIAGSYEAQLGRPAEQKLGWPQTVEDMGRDSIAKTAFDRTGSRVAAAAGYRFRQGISTIQDEGASFKAMMGEINRAAGKYRAGFDTILPSG